MKSRKSGAKIEEDLNREDVAEYILSEERTVLSKQRTALAFVQTGLAAVGAGLIVVKFWEDVAFRYVGVILMVFGFYEIVNAYPKLVKYEKRLRRVKELVKKSKWGRFEYGESELE
jgi:uncharacterized membrane protein YidH (DUF202 family)